jgi:NADH-quinone oxidoreductase subunit C
MNRKKMSDATPTEDAVIEPGRSEALKEQIAALLGDSADVQLDPQSAVKISCTPQNLIYVLKSLRDDAFLQFRQLTDLTAVDYPERTERFELVYILLSIAENCRVRVCVPIDEDAVAPSATELFAAANWAEREVWDMFGIYFSGHPDLRRLLTDYGFEGHPLRKDFPLTGYVEVRYSETQRRVVYEPVHLTQEYRDFDFMSPWEGVQADIAPPPSEDEAGA